MYYGIVQVVNERFLLKKKILEHSNKVSSRRYLYLVSVLYPGPFSLTFHDELEINVPFFIRPGKFSPAFLSP